MATNTATYAALPTAAATKAAPALSGVPAITAASAHAGAIVTSATIVPAVQRPATMSQVGVGVSHVKWNVPARTSAPSTESPITSAAMGTTSPKMPSAATRAKARCAGLRMMMGRRNVNGLFDRMVPENPCWAGSWTACASSPNSSAPAHGTRIAAHRFRGKQERNV